MRTFETNVGKFNTPLCVKCSRISLLTKVPRNTSSYICRGCSSSSNKKKLQENLNDVSADIIDSTIENHVETSITRDINNDIINQKDVLDLPEKIPLHLRDNMLTFVEEQLIALVFVQQYIYLRGFGEVSSKGHCINFNQNISNIARILPRLPSELPIVIVKRKTDSGSSQDLKVRRNVVMLWLNYLKTNSMVPGYKNMIISQERLDALPEDGPLDGITIIDSDNDLNIHTISPSNQNDKDDRSDMKFIPTDLECDDFEDNQPLVESGVTCPISIVEKESEKIKKFLNEISVNKEPELEYPEHSIDPLSEFNTAYLASMAFPTLFPTGKGDPFAVSERTHKESLLTRVKKLLYYGEYDKDSLECRFAQHPRFVMWIHNIIYRHKTLDQGNVYLQQNQNDKMLSTEEIKTMIENGQINNVINNLKRYMANIPGSSSYWQSVHNDLSAIIDSKGPPHVFFTHSYADFYDPCLHEFLKLPKGSPRNIIHKKLRKYPHLVNWFFLQKFKEFAKQYYINHLNACPDKGGWLWYRFEWQHRGAIHVHGLLRMGNMPDTYLLANKCVEGHITSLKGDRSEYHEKVISEGLDAEKKLIKIYDQFVNCDYIKPILPDVDSRSTGVKPQELKFSEVRDPDNDLNDLIGTLQHHVCRVGGCMKTYKGVLQPCRFHFPQEKSEVTKLKYENKKKNCNDPDKWELHIVPKRLHDDRISAHNKTQLIHWRANVDFSIVYDYNKVTRYVAKYATKAETKSNAYKTAFEEIYFQPYSGASTTHQNMKKVMNKVLGFRDISMHEALHLTMSLDLHWSNISVVKASLVKSNAIKKSKNGNIDVHPDYLDLYASRRQYLKQHPDVLNMNFVEFVCKFEKKISNQCLVPRKNTSNVALRIFQKYCSNPLNSSYPLYCKFQLLRYKPWENDALDALEGISDCNDSWISGWNNFCKSSLGKEKIPSWNKSLDAQNRIDEDQLSEGSDSEDEEIEDLTNQEDWMRVACGKLVSNIDNELSPEIANYWAQDRAFYSSDELCEMANWLKNQKQNHTLYTRLSSYVDPGTLNEEQLRAYSLVRNHWLVSDPNDQLLLRLEGTAGTGKSHVINAWCGILSDGSYYIAAPTGRAAHNVGGLTLHSLLSLGVRKSVNCLSGEALKALQERFIGVRYLIVDEYSMVGGKMLSLIDKRLRQATGREDKLFGGINMLLVGDTKQLPPVKDIALWSRKYDGMNDSAKEGVVIFKQFDKVITLNRIVRQDGPSQKRFRETLLRLRVGNSTYEDYEMLSSRISSIANDCNRFSNSVYLMHSNNEVNMYNLERLNTLARTNERICNIKAHHNHNDARALSSEQMLGLESDLLLARGARVMLTSNEWTQVGLTNGATGTVRHIIFEEGGGPPNLPVAVILEMDTFYKGPHLLDKPRHVIITPKTCSFHDGKKTLERTQLPLRLAYAITIHKSQGMTLESAKVKLGKTESPIGLTFVALSRVKRLEDLLIDYENFDSAGRITNIKLPKHIIEFDRETERLADLTKIFMEQNIQITIT